MMVHGFYTAVPLSTVLFQYPLLSTTTPTTTTCTIFNVQRQHYDHHRHNAYQHDAMKSCCVVSAVRTRIKTTTTTTMQSTIISEPPPSWNQSSIIMKAQQRIRSLFHAGISYTRLLYLVVLSIFFFLVPPAAARTAAVSTTNAIVTATGTVTTIHTLGTTNIGLAAMLVFVTSGLGLHFVSGVPKLSRDIIKACVRSSIQLFFFGGTILTQLLIAGQTRSWLVWSWIALTAMIAANEAYHRVEYTYPQLPWHLVLSFMIGGGVVIGSTVALRILGPVRPWYTPRVWIPVAGMMLGNALTGTALAAKTVTKEFAINADQIELRLTQGATWREAIQVPLDRNHQAN